MNYRFLCIIYVKRCNNILIWRTSNGDYLNLIYYLYEVYSLIFFVCLFIFSLLHFFWFSLFINALNILYSEEKKRKLYSSSRRHSFFLSVFLLARKIKCLHFAATIIENRKWKEKAQSPQSKIRQSRRRGRIGSKEQHRQRRRKKKRKMGRTDVLVHRWRLT